MTGYLYVQMFKAENSEYDFVLLTDNQAFIFNRHISLNTVFEHLNKIEQNMFANATESGSAFCTGLTDPSASLSDDEIPF